ncbi:MAG: hypothetical protein WCG23_09775 [bacterium]
MEYVQELDKIKTEVANSGKKLEDLSNLMQNLSGLANLQDSIKDFQEDNVLNRIETKIDIIAQTDYSECFDFSAERLIKDSLLEDLTFLKENFYKINEKFSEINHLIKTNTAESEELNNRFERNLTNFNSGFQNVYERFNNLDNTFSSSFSDFKTCINDIYDQFSTIDNRKELDQIKFYVQSFSNKILSIAEILEELKENNFSITTNNKDELQELEENKKKLELLNSAICSLKDKIEMNAFSKNEKAEEINDKLNFILNENSQEINDKLNSILDETQNFSIKISDEFSSLTNPLSSAIELTYGLKESVDELLSRDNVQIKKETGELLDKFETTYKNAETNFEYIFNASKLFYEKLEEIKNEFSNISYDTNSKIIDFISKTDSIEFKIQNTLSSSETALIALKNISRFTENQINLTSESINSLKTGVFELSEEFGLFKNDLTEISSKLNKLILNEKNNSTLFISSFKELKEEINKTFEANLENLNKTGEKILKNLSAELKDLNKKLDNAENISAETLETTKDVKNALVCISEWFDAAGKLIEENNQLLKKNSIERVDVFIKRTEENVTEKIKRVSDKLNRFEIRMENIEGKIEKLYDQHSNREVLRQLSDILEKVEIANERSKSNELILNRLEQLESRIEEFEDKKAAKNKKRLSEEKF